MELESIDPTSATLLGRVGLSPNDQVAWARFVGAVRLEDPRLVPALGVAGGRHGRCDAGRALAPGPEARSVPVRPVAQFPRLAAER